MKVFWLLLWSGHDGCLVGDRVAVFLAEEEVFLLLDRKERDEGKRMKGLLYRVRKMMGIRKRMFFFFCYNLYRKEG